VKAIRVQAGQAAVDPGRCLGCGTCRRECPQQAKVFRNDLERAAQLMACGDPVTISLAPSYAAVFEEWQRRRLAGALRRLGARWVEETALGAESAASLTARFCQTHPDQPVICSACPAVVRYLELYRSDLLPYLAPVASPMIAHARLIKQRRGERTRVLFVGPCVAKKLEAERPEYAGLVDVVITFAELAAWLEQEGIRLPELEESEPDVVSKTAARFFPIAGGLARTAGCSSDLLATEVVAVSGFEMLDAVLDDIQLHPRPSLIEPLFCPEGCVNGPGLPVPGQVFAAKQRLLQFGALASGPVTSLPEAAEGPVWQATPVPNEFSDQDIQRVLAQTGKASLEDQLNCGACGYASCRDKAKAVLAGMAEPEMCIPQMIRLAERRTDRIIETTPNAIVMLNQELNILSVNQAFRRMFQCTDAVLGKSMSHVFDPVGFEKLVSGSGETIEGRVAFPAYNLICHQILYPLKDDRQYVGIFVNMTHLEDTEMNLKKLKQQTILQSQELLEHQIRMAQDLVKFLGENTAKSERLVKNLTEAALADSADGPDTSDPSDH
jgi:Fe-S-cluster-containing hydrogenase component 2/uncharacterized Fe-S cluster-containing protein